jgi:hypothetical protein
MAVLHRDGSRRSTAGRRSGAINEVSLALAAEIYIL